MTYQFSRKGCFKCGNRQSGYLFFCSINSAPNIVGHIAENCASDQRLCYNCRQSGHESSACPSPRTVSTKQCYSCGGVGHIQGISLFPNAEMSPANVFFTAECPTLRVQQAANQKCYVRTFFQQRISHDLQVLSELWTLWSFCS